MPRGSHKPEAAKFLTREQVAALLEAAEKRTRDYFLLATTFYLALRVGEVVVLGPMHFRLPFRDVMIPTEKRRIRKGQPLDKRTGRPLYPVGVMSGLDVLGRLLEWAGDREWIFQATKGRVAGPMSTRTAQSIFKRWAGVAGIDPIYSIHSLRHTACSLLYQATKNLVTVKEFARHSLITTTSVYAHSMDWEKAGGALDL